MQTREVSWMFHEPRSKRLHRLWVPDSKLPPNLAIDAINWEAPIADEIGSDNADSIHLHITAQAVNCLEPTHTEGLWPIVRKQAAPNAWIHHSDPTNQITERYREEKEWQRTIRHLYYKVLKDCEAEETFRAAFPQVSEEQRQQQQERNRLMAEEEAEERSRQKERLAEKAKASSDAGLKKVYFRGGPLGETVQHAPWWADFFEATGGRYRPSRRSLADGIQIWQFIAKSSA